MRHVLVLIVALLLAGTALAQRPPAAPVANLIDLNSASRDELMTLDGIGEVRADAIIRSRPFRTKGELVDRHMIPEALYDKINDRLVAKPVPGTAPVPQAKPVPQQPKRS